MISQYNKLSMVLGIPGIILQIGGYIYERMTLLQLYPDDSWAVKQDPVDAKITGYLIVGGTILLCMSFRYFAKSKGRSPAWCSVAFLSFIGVFIMACLKDRSDTKTG